MVAQTQAVGGQRHATSLEGNAGFVLDQTWASDLGGPDIDRLAAAFLSVRKAVAGHEGRDRYAQRRALMGRAAFRVTRD
jgi:hypothetical protein